MGKDRTLLPGPPGASGWAARARAPSGSLERLGADVELKAWAAELLERQQSTFQKLLIQQHEALGLSLGEKIERVESLVASQGRMNEIGCWMEPRDNGLEAELRESQAQAAARNLLEPVRPPQAGGDEAGGVGQIDKKAVRTIAVAGVPKEPLRVPPATSHSIREPDTSYSGILKRMVRSKIFDLVIGLVIVANMICMFVQLEWAGWRASMSLGQAPLDEVGWGGAKGTFKVFEEMFNVCFVVELVLRVYTYRLKYFAEVLHVFDASIVVLTCADAYVYQPLTASAAKVAAAEADEGDQGIGGLLRVFRVVRILKVLRFLTQFEELRILMRALVESAGAFLWSMLLATIIMISGGIFMATVTSQFIMDSDMDLDTRMWLYRYYGSAARATYTMFEVTFSGGWPGFARRTIEDASVLFVLFWVIYVLGVTFAMVRVIAALFLKQTMAVAVQEKEKTKLEGYKENGSFENVLHDFLVEMDTSGDGVLSRRELADMLDDENLQTALQHAELKENEVVAIFEMFDPGDGQVPMGDFLNGAVRLKRSGVDAAFAFQAQQQTTAEISKLAAGVDALHHSLEVGLKIRRTWRSTDPTPKPPSRPISRPPSCPSSARHVGIDSLAAVCG